MPNVPTLKELGVNVVFDVNRGIMAPKGTPADVIAKLDSSCAAAAKEPEFAKAMKLQGTDVRYLDREAYTKWLKETDELNRSDRQRPRLAEALKCLGGGGERE